MRYRIHWKAVKTGKTGYGRETYPKEQAEMICEGFNHRDKGLIVHWIEPVGDTRTPSDSSQEDKE